MCTNTGLHISLVVPCCALSWLHTAAAYSECRRRHCCSYGLHLFLLSIDEGISGYRDDSLDTVKRNEAQYQVTREQHAKCVACFVEAKRRGCALLLAAGMGGWPHAVIFCPLPQIPLHVFSYKDLYGWTMDEIVRQIGTKSNCTFCGVFRRQVCFVCWGMSAGERLPCRCRDLAAHP